MGIIRTFAINKVLLMSAAQISSLKTEWHPNGIDEELLEFMDDKHNDLDNIHDVKWRDFREKTDDPSMSLFTKKFWVHHYGKLWLKYRDEDNNHKKHTIGCIVSWIMTFILCPIYFLSRFLNLLSPAFVVLYLYFRYDILFWYGSIDAFQVTIFLVYCFFMAFSFSFLVFSGIVQEQWYGWHIMPISPTLHAPNNKELTALKFREITDYYDSIIFVPIIQSMIDAKLGADIGLVIMRYYHNILYDFREDSHHSEVPYHRERGEFTELPDIEDTDHDEEKAETSSLLRSSSHGDGEWVTVNM